MSRIVHNVFMFTQRRNHNFEGIGVHGVTMTRTGNGHSMVPGWPLATCGGAQA